MARGRCWVEFDENGPVKIFRGYSEAVYSEAWNLGRVKEFPRRDGVARIRERVFKRAANQCEDCGKNITWNFHMHEKIPRGKGGEISVENSIALCADCHLNFEHGNRRLRFGE